MLRFENKSSNIKMLWCKKKQTNKQKKKRNWDVNVDNIVISKSIETKNSSKYLIGELDDVIRPLLLIVPN